MLYLYVLQQRALRPVRLPAFLRLAHELPLYFVCAPPQPLLLVLVFGVGEVFFEFADFVGELLLLFDAELEFVEEGGVGLEEAANFVGVEVVGFLDVVVELFDEDGLGGNIGLGRVRHYNSSIMIMAKDLQKICSNYLNIFI